MENREAKLRPNIGKMYVMAACLQSLFMMPIIVPFFRANGLSMSQVFLLQGAFSAWMMLIDIPTGYLSDIWSRKKVLVAGCIFGITGVVVYSCSRDFWGFLIGELLWATMLGLHSGTIEAMTFETLCALNMHGEYRRIQGLQGFYGLMVQASASLLGGVLSVWSLRATVWATVIPFVLGLCVATTMEDPPRLQHHEVKKSPRALLHVAKYVIIEQPLLRYVSLIGSFTLSLTLTLMWFTQPYQEAIDFPQWLFGFTHGAVMVGSAFMSRLAAPLSHRLGEERYFIVVAGFVACCYLLGSLPMSIGGIAIILPGRCCSGLVRPVMSDIVNRMAPEGTRATALSVRSFIERLIFSAGMIIVGHYSDIMPVNMVLLRVGCFAAVTFAALFLLARGFWHMLPAMTTVSLGKETAAEEVAI